MYGNLSFITEILLECRYFSPLLIREDFQSWFISFRLNYWKTWPFLKAGYLHSKNSPDFATLFLTPTMHHGTACLLISSCFPGLVSPLWGFFAQLSFKSSFHFHLPNILTAPKAVYLSLRGQCWKPYRNIRVALLLHLGESIQKKKKKKGKKQTIMRFIYTR